MNLQTLLEKYQNDPRIKSIADEILLPEPSRFYLKNLYGSAAAFAFCGLYQQPEHQPLNHLVILDSAEEAAYHLFDSG